LYSEQVLAWALEILGEDDSLEPVLGDAESFMAENERTYDLVFVDVFRGKAVPEFVTSPLFLKQCRNSLSPGGRLALNYIAVNKKKWEKVQRVLAVVFPGSHTLGRSRAYQQARARSSVHLAVRANSDLIDRS